MSDSQNSFVDLLRPGHGYFLSDVRLDLPNPATAIFKARLNGPAGKPVWARAWLSTEDGTLAESASDQLNSGDEVVLELAVPSAPRAQYAYMRIESAPLNTEHVVMLKFT